MDDEEPPEGVLFVGRVTMEGCEEMLGATSADGEVIQCRRGVFSVVVSSQQGGAQLGVSVLQLCYVIYMCDI